ncbi:protein GAST1 [Rhododendron vialii]|uniref:protein GAST1 n=1 Tax=Rhododendron vialii TaxID=182163 RepID=UPI00265ED599|nr:protein GAST1 [Rhododendron vialii]
MGGKPCVMRFYLIMVLLLVEENNAMMIATESPTPQPQPTGNLPTYGATPGSLHPQECSPQCTTRCSKTAYKKPCMFFCQKCCSKCLCVPPGTYGNKQFCPCYNNWKTKRGGPKCP